MPVLRALESLLSVLDQGTVPVLRALDTPLSPRFSPVDLR